MNHTTALHYAALNNQLKSTQLLLALGAPINEVVIEGHTALHNAIDYGHSKIVKLLLDSGANIECKLFIAKSTPLNNAVMRGNTEIIQLLIDKGADLETVSIANMRPIHFAIILGKIGAVQQLVKAGAKTSTFTAEGFDSLHLAIQHNKFNIIKFLVQSGVNVNVRDSQQNVTPLLYAISKGTIEMVSYLIDKGAAVNAQSKGTSPLHYALQGNHQKISEYLVTVPGANLAIANSDLNTPLHLAAFYGRDNLTKMLLQRKVDVNAQNRAKITPLHYAIQNRNIISIQLLLDAGADKTLKYNENKNAFDIAKDLNDANIIQMLTNPSTESSLISRERNSTVTSQTGSSSLGKTPELGVSSSKDHYSLPINVIPYSSIKLGEKIGEGGFGKVYRAKWNFQDVAIKQLRMKSMSDRSEKEFMNETRIWKKLSHPNIIQLFGICSPPDPYCMVMKYKPNGSLFKLLHSKQNLPWTSRIQLAIDIGSALIFLHKRNIIHRDLKSLNILTSIEDNNLRASLTDFGLSIVKTETSITTHKFKTNQRAGTLRWLAQELFEGKKSSKQSDMYSFGMVLWELSSRKIPFQNIKQARLSTYIQKDNKPIIPSNTPKEITELIKKCWDKDQRNRPTAMEAVEILTQQKIKLISSNRTTSVKLTT